MKYFLLLLFLPILFIQGCKEEAVKINSNVLTIETSQGQFFDFNVELAISPDQQANGLMHRQSMPAREGMLFLFPNSAERSFWMKNTFIPLDIIFIRENGIIHHIHPHAIPHNLKGMRSNGPVMAVLEINAGLSDKLGIRSGDQVVHPAFQDEK